ncbi:MAG: deoxyribonuclease IV [Bacilli bacterium]|nr:deoxyribonuclease IV [Bacilli bacterium]
MNKEILIGSHVSMSGPEYYLGSVKEAISYGSTTFMFYTGAPQNSIRKPTSELRIAEARELIKQSGFDESKIIVHAPYIINIGNSQNSELYEISKRNLTQELRRVKDFGLSILVLHPGSHVKTGIENGLNSIINALNEIFENDGTDVKIALETMAGKGSELGANFNEIKSIIDGVNKKERIGVCLDTCHISDEGVDVSKVDEVLDEFDKIIGLDKLLCIHINDSKNPRESHKDRHENIGYGYVGFETINNFVHNPRLSNIPKILETPYVNGKAPYKKEIEMLKNSTFIENWRDNL